MSSNNGPVISELPASSQDNGGHGNVAAAAALEPIQRAEPGMAGHQLGEEVPYTIGDEPSSFTEFIEDLRRILSQHENSEDIRNGLHTDQKHPLLPKLRGDQQPERWIRIKLQAVVNKKTSSATLLMRDDNVDIKGFMNQDGRWCELGYRCTIPNSVLLGWGNSYKSILGVRKEEEVMDRLRSAKLGKNFARDAVRLLSRYPDGVDGIEMTHRLAVVGLMFMVSESARMKPVHDAIARGWGPGTGFTKHLMTDYVWKYVEMSRRLRHWKRGNYAEEERPYSELRVICLVLNEEYDLLSFACPEMLKESFPDMFKVVSMATVVVNLRPVEEGWQHMEIVCGKIAALIRDKHRNSAYFRVGSRLFTCTEGMALCSNPMPLEVARSVVAVPSGWVLHIEVDLHIKTSNSNAVMKHLNVTLSFDNYNESETKSETKSEIHEGIQVKVEITCNDKQQEFPLQLNCPVEVKMESGYTTLVYTVGDVMSFTEFITALRRIVVDHPYREEILDGHDLLNLSSSREHPVLAKQRPVQPSRWLHIKLQLVEGNQRLWTTLIMRDDNLYVHGFVNQQGVCYELRDGQPPDASSTSMFGSTFKALVLYWGISYKTILDAKTSNDAVAKLAGVRLGCHFARDAVLRLSSTLYPDDNETDGLMSARLALAGLILMVCESARFNPIHDFFVQGWKRGTRWTMDLMKRYVWVYADMSSDLLAWKRRWYAQSHPINELQAIYLVLNTNKIRRGNPGRHHQRRKPSPGNPGSGGDPPGPSHRRGGGNNGDRGGGKRKRDFDDRSPQSHPSKKPATSARGARGRACKSEEASDAGSGGGSGKKSEHASFADSGESPDIQSEEFSDAASTGESDETNDDNGQSGDGDTDGDDDDDDPQFRGRPRVELLSMRADLGVIGNKITVFDGKRGQIIYTKEGQGEKGKLVDLVLTGPYKGISAYGCFAIVIDIPDDTAAGDSSGDSGGSIQWEWDCYDPKYAEEVDQPPRTGEINAQDGSKVAEVTYVVMSNAREATVQHVKLQLRDGPSHGGIISGEITALIEGFKEEHKSVLFRHEKGMGQRFSTTDYNSWFLLQLSRNVVSVPCGSALHIQVDLQIVTEDGTEVEVNDDFYFGNGICSTQTNLGTKVQVKNTWYPEVELSSHPPCAPDFLAEPPNFQLVDREVQQQQQQIKMILEENLLSVAVDSIRDSASFTEFITELRRILAKHPDRNDILEHPLLARQRAEQPARWVHVKLQVVDENNETLSTTLLMRDDDLYVHGFMNQQRGVCCTYELLDSHDGNVNMLPKDYNPKRLDWGVNYSTILGVGHKQAAVDKLAAAKLDKTFMVNAVQLLSGWRHSDQQHVPLPGCNTNMSARVALAGLIFMICESARMNYVRDSFADGWSSGKGFTKELMNEYVCKYGEMSRKLLAWKSRNYAEPHCISELQATYLVLNTWLPGQARVELLALSMRGDLLVEGVKIVVFDGKRGQIIYTVVEQGKEEEKRQGEEGMVDLVLTGPYRGISAEYGCFAIKIDIPSSSSSSDKHLPITWEWDCDVQMYADEVDKQPHAHHTISGPDGEVAKVTYAVMSNAREAAVQVKLRLKDGNSPTCVSGGKITALIDGFDVPIVLLNCSESTGYQGLSASTAGDSWFLLQLARNVVAVPCCTALQIDANLQIKTSDDQMVNYSHSLNFYNDGVCSTKSLKNDHISELQVNITWYPEVKMAPEVIYTIGDELSYLSFIMDLRRVAANHTDREDILDGHYNLNLSSTREHPLLPKLRAGQPARWLHVKLQVVQEGNETSSTTLAMRDDNLFVHGFRNQQGVWYGLVSDDPSGASAACMVPPEYNPKRLDWGGIGYKSLLERKPYDEAMAKLEGAHLGRYFAVDAVRILSNFPIHPDDEVDGEMSARLALAGLMFMVCESARMNPVLESIAGGWSTGTGFTKNLMTDYVWKYGKMSRLLQEWKRRNYKEPHPYSELRAVHLVLNTIRPARGVGA